MGQSRDGGRANIRLLDLCTIPMQRQGPRPGEMILIGPNSFTPITYSGSSLSPSGSPGGSGGWAAHKSFGRFLIDQLMGLPTDGFPIVLPLLFTELI